LLVFPDQKNNANKPLQTEMLPVLPVPFLMHVTSFSLCHLIAFYKAKTPKSFFYLLLSNPFILERYFIRSFLSEWD
jgi:hypothetical protein